MPKGRSETDKAKHVHHLLTLPQELRQYIYQNILQTMPSSLFDLLMTSRQVADEVKPLLYKQEIEFDGQSELFNWLQDADRDYFGHVEGVSFKLHDIDPQKIVGALGKRLRQSARDRDAQSPPEDNPYRQACELEVQRIFQGLALLPNLKRLTLRRCTVSDPRPPRHMLLTFAKLLTMRLPNLQVLASHEECLPLKILPSLRKLRKFSFTGLTTSDSTSVKDVFSKMEDLVELELHGPDPSIDDEKFQQRAGRPELRRCEPIEILESLPYSLQAFAFREMTGTSCFHGDGGRPVNTMQSIIEVLEEHDNLCYLELLSSAKLKSTAKARLASLICHAPLQKLDVFVDDFLSFEMLPRTITRVVWRFSRSNTLSVPFITGLLSQAKAQRERLCRLGEIVVLVDRKPVESDLRRRQQRAVELMRTWGLSLFWESWEAPTKIGA